MITKEKKRPSSYQSQLDELRAVLDEIKETQRRHDQLKVKKNHWFERLTNKVRSVYVQSASIAIELTTPVLEKVFV